MKCKARANILGLLIPLVLCSPFLEGCRNPSIVGQNQTKPGTEKLPPTLNNGNLPKENPQTGMVPPKNDENTGSLPSISEKQPVGDKSSPLKIELTAADSNAIAQQIFLNEGQGKRENLVYWSENEAFPSMGIAHFIWYPEDSQDAVSRFGGDSFPPLVRYLQDKGEVLPDILKKSLPELVCPWKNRAEFLNDKAGAESIRAFLDKTKGHQSAFVFQRFAKAYPAMLASAEESEREKLKTRIEAVIASKAGFFPLVDYVNFKGEGLKGGSWGLLQVLQNMQDTNTDAAKEFAAASARVLTKRVEKNPKDGVFLAGWINRTQVYASFVLPSKK
jgi:hypothetical protein